MNSSYLKSKRAIENKFRIQMVRVIF